MSRIAVALASLLVLCAPAPGRAAFHIAVIDELMSGAGGNANVQYVEVRMLMSGQFNVAHTRLTVFKCVANGGGFQVLIDDLGGPSAVNPALSNSAVNARWIMASPSGATFLAASGITPDFTWDNSVTGNIPTSCGMVCWGAPGTITPQPPPWPGGDAGNPANYVDCVAYGPYDGTAEPLGAAPASATPGGGTFSLTRKDTNAFSNDFALACPSPTSNPAQAMGNFGPCTPPTTTTTSVTTSTTTTTIPSTGPSKCTAKEFAAAGKKAAAKTKCESKVIAKNDTSSLMACNTSAETKFGTAFSKAMGPADCVNPAATAGNVETTVNNYISNQTTQLAGASTGPSKCTSKAVAAAGKLASSEAACHGKSVGKGDPSTISPCVAAAKTKFETAYGKATGAGDCIMPTVTATDVEGTVDTFIGNLTTQLAP